MTATALASPSAVLLMAPDDNSLIARTALVRGACILIDGAPVVLSQDIAIGHKVARAALGVGDRVLRYGAIIGSVTQPVGIGEHVEIMRRADDARLNGGPHQRCGCAGTSVGAGAEPLALAPVAQRGRCASPPLRRCDAGERCDQCGVGLILWNRLCCAPRLAIAAASPDRPGAAATNP